MNMPIAALEQSFGRTKAKNLAEYMKVADLKANSSNDTLYADDKGNAALLLPQFVPLRDNKFDYTKPVDGSNPDTTWKGTTPIDNIPHVVNPASGWVFNSNDTPQNAAGPNTVDMSKFPNYMDAGGRKSPRRAHGAGADRLQGHDAATADRRRLRSLSARLSPRWCRR